MSTQWMAMAYKSLTSKYSEYRNRWISDDKWMEIIRNNYIDNPSKEKEAGIKFNRRNLVKAIGSRWGTTIDDFTETNQKGIFRHRYFVSCQVEDDEGKTKSSKIRVTYFYATIPKVVLR